jgi:hypothetical protein
VLPPFSTGWPQTQSSYISLLSAGIASMKHHAQPLLLYMIRNIGKVFKILRRKEQSLIMPPSLSSTVDSVLNEIN